MKKIILILSCFFLIFFLIGCTQQSIQQKETTKTQETTTEYQPSEETYTQLNQLRENPEIPAIVAKINGKDITRQELLNIQSNLKSQNPKTTLNESLNQLIIQTILLQEADNRGYDPAPQDIENLYIKSGYTIEQLKQHANNINQNYTDFLLKQKEETKFYMLLNHKKTKVNITQEQIQEYYDNIENPNKQSYDELEDEIEYYLEEQIANQLLIVLANELMEQSEIEIYI
jgi:hypothetical protein